MTRSIRLAAVAGSLCAAAVALRGERVARACAGGEWTIAEVTTFDPGVLGDPRLEGVYYEPYRAGFGGYLPGFGDDALIADWHGYLAGAVSDADWRKVLFETSAQDVAAIQGKLAGKPVAAPKGFERSSLWNPAAPPAAKARLAAAVALVKLARDVEPSAAFYEPWDQSAAAARPAPTRKLLDAATAGMAAATDPFLAQRYAFQAVRILFYQRDAKPLTAFFDRHAAVLAGPSESLHWRARYYLAGALSWGSDPRGYLELAHVHANHPPLSGAAAGDFHPASDDDWRAALKLAKTTRDKTELWRRVGVKFDGVAAMREIIKLDPRSDLLAMLMVRELVRNEGMVGLAESGDPDVIAVHVKLTGVLEQIALQLASTPGADRPWLWHLAAGHIAAMRGDLPVARDRLGRALAGKPGDVRVASQAKASLALALVANWKLDSAHETELAAAMNSIDPSYQRTSTVRSKVRDPLAKVYLAARRLVDAEYLHPGTVDPNRDPEGYNPQAGKLQWASAGFIRDMIARRRKLATEFDRFVIDQPALTEPALQQELALRLALDGDFAAADQIFKSGKAESTRLEVDPFVTHIKDCRECDQQNYAKAPWTHASVVARLVKLAATARSSGDAAAEAAIQIGNALYNITMYGNARRVLRPTHQDTYDTRPAERWYQRAYEQAKTKELKARAAYLAAKAERGVLFDVRPENDDSPGLPVPTKWFGKLKQLSDTRYYREVLKECSTFQSWVGP